MEKIDIAKVTGKSSNEFEVIDNMVKSHQSLIEALSIMKSTIENFDDSECLELNKERMVNFFSKFSKD